MMKGTSLRGTAVAVFLMAGLAAGWPATAFAQSSITGTVTYKGAAPKLPPIAMDADPACAKMHGKPAPNEVLVLGSGNTMGNILVSVSKGLPAGKTYPAPKTAAVIDQKGCQYVPRVLGIQVGQPYRILNSDGIMHNVNAQAKVNRGFNRPMPGTLKEVTGTFDREEVLFQMKCDVHPWMTAHIAVFSHPFYSVTGTDGKFTISGLDPGTYVITAWHERLAPQTATVTVGAKEAKTQDFTFAPPAK
jgi:plastocyanin